MMKRCPGILENCYSNRDINSWDFDIKEAVVRIAKTNTILKRPVNKLFPIWNTYQNINETDKAKELKFRGEAAVTDKLKKKYEC